MSNREIVAQKKFEKEDTKGSHMQANGYDHRQFMREILTCGCSQTPRSTVKQLKHQQQFEIQI
jgi:hypothetical protein